MGLRALVTENIDKPGVRTLDGFRAVGGYGTLARTLRDKPANGELGFYVIADGSGHPYRIKCRPPCFAIFQAFDEMLRGAYLADMVAVLGSLNIVAGELER